MQYTSIITQEHPEIVRLIKHYLQPLLLWFSTYLYDRLLHTDADHPLVALATLVDFTEMETACADYHQHSGRGRKETHTVPHLLRCMVVKYLDDRSLRETEAQIRYNIAAKWFCGYAIFDSGPDHSTLSRFENYLIIHHQRLFFDSVLDQILQAYPGQRQQTQLADTFALQADAALESLVTRLRHSGQQLLHATRTATPRGYAALYADSDMERLFGTADAAPAYTLTRQEYSQRLETIVSALYSCVRQVKAISSAPAVMEWATHIEKIMSDELRLTIDTEEQLVGVALRPNDDRGTYRICSATDPDATIRNHGPGKQDFGYNVSVAATTDFIFEIQADTGSRPDEAALPELLAAQRQHHAHCPEKIAYDQAAGKGKTMAEVDAVTDGQTRLVVQPIDYDQRTERYGPRQFTLAGDGNTLTCPNGATSQRKYRSGSGQGHIFRFVSAQCQDCPLLKACRGSAQQPTTNRDVYISDYYAFVVRALAYSQTEEFRLEKRQRPQIERVIATLVQHHGCRYARFRGIEKVDFQVKMQAMAFNLKRWLTRRRHARDGKPPKQCHRFGAPVPLPG